MGSREPTNSPAAPRDVDLARAQLTELRDLRMVMEDLLARGLPGAADEFPWPVLAHDGANLLHLSPACLRWLDCTSDGTLVGQPLEVLCSELDRRSLLAAVAAGSLEPPAFAHLQRYRSQTGQTLLGRTLARRQAWGGRAATFVLIEPASATDRSFELLRLLGEAVDHLTDIVFITEANAIDDVGRRIVFVNRAFREASGFEAIDVLGKTPNITVGSGTDRQTLARLEAGLRQTRPVREDLLKYRKDGAPYWVELQIIPVFDEAGVHSHWVSIQRDITERKRLEGRLMESARLASAGLLSASLSSELNSPLASVTSSLEWLAERLPALLAPLGDSRDGGIQEVLEALSDARAGAARIAAATIYLQLLGNATPLARTVVSIAELLDAAVAHVERQLARPIPVERDYEPQLLVTADPGRMSHALRLAFLNAAVASGAGQGVKLRLSSGAGRVHVSIDDQGPGIAADMAGTLNAPFGSRKPQGLGDSLALFVASRLVAEVEGELLLIARPAGTRVEIRLPRQV